MIYPCITAEEYSYPGIKTVHGKGLDGETLKLLSLENYAGPHTPPAYLCHSAEDTCVPVMNTLLFAAALAKNNVPFETHVFQKRTARHQSGDASGNARYSEDAARGAGVFEGRENPPTFEKGEGGIPRVDGRKPEISVRRVFAVKRMNTKVKGDYESSYRRFMRCGRLAVDRRGFVGGRISAGMPEDRGNAAAQDSAGKEGI